MAVIIKTSRPRNLLNKLNDACKSEALEGWICDEDGDFTKTTTKYMKAWMRPNVSNGELIFSMIGPKEKKVSTTAYAFYHSDFIELLLNHFDSDFNSAMATSLPISSDSMG